MKHYIDLGTHKFEGLQEFSEKLNIDETWSVYCYEANPFTYEKAQEYRDCLLYTSPSPRDRTRSRMPSSA